MQYVEKVVRIILGAVFLIFGLNGFFGFIPMPQVSDSAGAFLGALAASGYFFPVLKVVETVSGLFLLTARFVPLALVLLAPITVQIFLYHIFLDPGGLMLAILLIASNIFLAYSYRGSFQSVLAQKVQPS